MTFGDNLARMQATIDAQRAKIERMEAANASLVDETIALRAAARPLLTDEEDEAGTEAMRELELRGADIVTP